MPSSAGPRRILTAVIVVAAVLGVGMLTYFSGGLVSDEAEEDTGGAVDFRVPEAPAAAPLKLVSEVRLPWDAEDGVARDPSGLSSLETVFGGDGGAVYVVDHPPGRRGARVRWYRGGDLAGTHVAPAGSTLFTASGPSLLYVIAKGQEDSERLVSVDLKSGEEQVFTVPLQVNSGPIVVRGRTVYVSAWSGFVDPETRETTGQDVLVPVATDGRQLTDDEARAGTVEAWRVEADGEAWRHAVTLSPEGGAQDMSSRVLERGSRKLRIPYTMTPLGVDASGRVWLLAPPTEVQERAVPGWPARADETAVLLAAGIDGRLAGAIPFALPSGGFWPDISLARRVGFDGRYLAIADMLAADVLVTVYEVIP